MNKNVILMIAEEAEKKGFDAMRESIEFLPEEDREAARKYGKMAEFLGTDAVRKELHQKKDEEDLGRLITFCNQKSEEIGEERRSKEKAIEETKSKFN